jgi:hypothetical protein
LLINHRARMTRCLIGRCDVAHSWAMRAVTLGVDSVRLRLRGVTDWNGPLCPDRGPLNQSTKDYRTMDTLGPTVDRFL